MKIIIFIFAYVVFLAGQTLSERVAEVLTEAKYNAICKEETKISTKRIEQLSANDVSLDETNKKDVAYIYCVLKNNNMVTKQGILYYANVMNGVKPTIKTAFRTAYELCLKVAECTRMPEKEKVVYLVMCPALKLKEKNLPIMIVTTKGI